MLIRYTMTSFRLWPDIMGHEVEFAGEFESDERFNRFKAFEERRLPLDCPIRRLDSSSRPETPTPQPATDIRETIINDEMQRLDEEGLTCDNLKRALDSAISRAADVFDSEWKQRALKAESSAPSSLVPRLREMTFETFSAVNRQRCESESGFNHKLDSWSTSDWFLAVLGELGEAANTAKKLNRVRDGIPGNKETPAALRDKLRGELGDVFVYLDLLAQSLDVSIGEAAVEVFNAKSAEIGCPIRMELREAADALEGKKEP